MQLVATLEQSLAPRDHLLLPLLLCWRRRRPAAFELPTGLAPCIARKHQKHQPGPRPPSPARPCVVFSCHAHMTHIPTCQPPNNLPTAGQPGDLQSFGLPPPAPPPSTPPAPPEAARLTAEGRMGIIVGSTVGGVAAVCCAAAATLWCCKATLAARAAQYALGAPLVVSTGRVASAAGRAARPACACLSVMYVHASMRRHTWCRMRPAGHSATVVSMGHGCSHDACKGVDR